MKESDRRIDFIDYVRGIAILFVFLYHAMIACYGRNSLPWERLIRGFYVPHSFIALLPVHLGWLGVPIFFVVSGFCIHISFQQQGQEWGGFFIRRFFRLYPAYLVALLLFAWLNVDKVHDLWFQFRQHAFLVHNFNSQTYYGLNPSFWSIAIEVQLYLLYPLLLMLVAKFGWKSTLLFVATGECCIHGWEAIYQMMLGVSGYDYPFLFNKLSPFFNCVNTPALAFLSVSPLAYWFSWSLGAAAADAFLKNEPMPLAKSSPIIWVTLVVAAYLVRSLFPFCFLFAAVLTTVVIGRHFSSAPAVAQPPGFWLRQLRLVGVYSYSIYLLHQPLTELFGHYVSHLFPNIFPFVEFLCCVGFWLPVMLLAAVWYRLIELPGVALGKRIIQKISDRKKIRENCPSSQSIQ